MSFFKKIAKEFEELGLGDKDKDKEKKEEKHDSHDDRGYEGHRCKFTDWSFGSDFQGL